MKHTQLAAMCLGYAAVFVIVAKVTRASSRRAFGAAAGGFVGGALVTLAAGLGHALGLWTIAVGVSAVTVALVYLAVAISCAPIPLVSWRVARRYGPSGLWVIVLCAAVVGPIRDYRVAAVMPDWMVFAPGLLPVLGVAVTYASLVVIGHATMYGIAGSSTSDPLARSVSAA